MGTTTVVAEHCYVEQPITLLDAILVGGLMLMLVGVLVFLIHRVTR